MKRWERLKPLVETVENLTFVPSAFDRRLWLEDIFNCSTSDMSSAGKHESEILNGLDQRFSALSPLHADNKNNKSGLRRKIFQ